MALHVIGTVQGKGVSVAYMIENVAMQHAKKNHTALRADYHTLCARIGLTITLDAVVLGSYAHRLRNCLVEPGYDSHSTRNCQQFGPFG